MARLPFILSRDTERHAIDVAIRDPAKRHMVYDMVDAVLRVRETEKVTEAELRPIREGFEATDEAVWSRAAGWLAKLHRFDPEISAVLEELAHHRNAGVRFRLCASLDLFPAEIAQPYLRRFLQDKSARVRGTVPNVAVKAGYMELIPDLETALERETDSAGQEDLREAIALLRGETFERKGWKVRKLPDGRIEYSPA